MRRKPKYRGTGIHGPQQYWHDLIKGDTFFCADFGMIIWDGKKWIQDHLAPKSLLKIAAI